MYDENSNAAAATFVALNNAAAAAAANSAPTAVNSSQLVNQLLTGKDSRWLMLEVCREYQRGQCSRSDLECKFAHPPATVDVQNGRVTACYDSIKGRCTRDKCKYLHPPQHLKDQLLINGRHHLQLKNHICSQLTQSPAAVAQPPSLPLLAQLMQQQQQQQQAMMPTTLAYQYFSQFPGVLYPALMPTGADHYQVQTPPPAVLQQLALLQQQQQQQQSVLQSPAPSNPLAAAQPNAALIMAILQQQQQQQQQMAAAQALANALAAAGHASPGMAGVVPATMPVMSTDTNGSSASSSTSSSRKRNAQTAGFDELSMPSSSSIGRNPSTSTVASSLAPAMQSGMSVTTSAAQSAVDSANAASLLQNLQAIRQSQMLFATAAASNGVMPQIKRSDKNMVPSTTAQIPMYAAAQPVTQFNPYLQQIPAGYLSTVSFNGAIPPRF